MIHGLLEQSFVLASDLDLRRECFDERALRLRERRGPVHGQDAGWSIRIADRRQEGDHPGTRADVVGRRQRWVFRGEVQHRPDLGVEHPNVAVGHHELDRRRLHHLADQPQERLEVVARIERAGEFSASLVQSLHPLALLGLLLRPLGVEPSTVGEEHEHHRGDEQRDPDRPCAPDERGQQPDGEVAGGMQHVEPVGQHEDLAERLLFDERDDERDEQLVQREVDEHGHGRGQPDLEAEPWREVEQVEHHLGDDHGDHELSDVVGDLVPGPSPGDLSDRHAGQDRERQHARSGEDQDGNPKGIREGVVLDLRLVGNLDGELLEDRGHRAEPDPGEDVLHVPSPDVRRMDRDEEDGSHPNDRHPRSYSPRKFEELVHRSSGNVGLIGAAVEPEPNDTGPRSFVSMGAPRGISSVERRPHQESPGRGQITDIRPVRG